MYRILWRVAAVLGVMFSIVSGPAFAADVPPITPNDMVLGKETAPITVIEYASMTCPHCAEFEKETWPKIKTNWVDTGKIRWVFRDFPLDGFALAASVTAHCLPAAQYYPFIETLYGNQQAWVVGSEPIEGLKRFAKFAGMSEDKFNSCISDDARKQVVIATRQSAEAAGVNSTPTFFVNGQMFAGYLPYEDFAAKLTAAQRS